MKNFEGKIITNPEEKKKVILTHFKHRMRKRPVKQELVDVIEKQEILFTKRVKCAMSVKSDPFTLKELETTLKTLMKGKSRDSEYFFT